jgi:hypothetical protein
MVKPSLRESSLAPANTKESKTSTVLATMVGVSSPRLRAMAEAAD